MFLFCEPYCLSSFLFLSFFFRYTNDHRLCCYFENSDNCISIDKQPIMFMCGSMMQNDVLRVFMWLLGLSATFGNLFVLFLRITTKTKNDVQVVQAIFVGNLALSDLFMGVYMLLLASVDAYFGNEFYKFSDLWRVSSFCRLASFLTIVSSETSLFLLFFITIDRFLVLLFPFSTYHFKKVSALILVVGIWCITLSLSSAPSILADPDSNFYALSDVCIGLPLVTRPTKYKVATSGMDDEIAYRTFDINVPSGSKVSWYFSVVVFLGINFILTSTIFVMYVVIFVSVRKSRRAVQKTPKIKQEIMMALRMTSVTMTNCMCWLPVTILGILSQTEMISITLEIYTWAVVFILPTNASLNPYLYTLSLLYK